MNTQSRRFSLPFALFVVALLLLTSACSLFTPHPERVSQVVEVTLDEQLFLNSQPSFKVHNHDFWEDLDVDVDRMELHDGFIRFLGIQRQADGSLEDCVIDVALGTEDGMLTASVISLDVPGMRLTDPIVVSINRDLDATLTLSTYSAGTGIRFQEVEVTEDALRLKILVSFSFWALK